MTKAKAIDILITSASRDLRGNGLGIKSTSDEWREDVKAAVRVAFKMIHKREITRNELFNYGF